MADTKISQLPAATTPLTGLEAIPMVQTGATVQAPVSQITNVVAATLNPPNNRIINGDMRIDQRNAGASVTPTVTGTYTLDRWFANLSVTSKYSVQQQTSIVPADFTHALKVTSLSAYSVAVGEQFAILQGIEGFNFGDFGFGTASAKSVTLSFLVYSSLTGTFGGSLQNGAANRSYPFTYSIISANTWTQISITIPGDTTGTWTSNNSAGAYISFGLGVGTTLSGTANTWAAANYRSATGAVSVVGTNAATWYITGVQLEPGTVATPFERRQYQQELALCQRYYQKSYAMELVPGTVTAQGALMITAADSSVLTRMSFGTHRFVVPMRATPTVTLYGTNGTSGVISLYNAASTTLTFSSFSNQSPNGIADFATFTTASTAGQSYLAHYTANIEL